MKTRLAVANGSNDVERKAARDANTVQDAVNLIAIVGVFHRHLVALSQASIGGDELSNHPVVLAFTSKINSLCRMTSDREMTALAAVERIAAGESVTYEVIPF